MWQPLTFTCFSAPPIDLRVQLLKHAKHDIVHSLCVLPKIQHDLSSFVVDIWFQMVSTCFLPRVAFRKPQVGRKCR